MLTSLGGSSSVRKLFTFTLLVVFYITSVSCKALISNQLKASDTQANKFKDLETACQQYSPECLAYLDLGLNSTKLYSRQWFRFKKLRLENLFSLQKYHQLQKEIDYWAPKKDTPVHFAVNVYIYQAKLLKYQALHSNVDLLSNDEKVRQIKASLTKASQILSEMNTAFESPIKLIEIANLQFSLQNYETAQKILLQLEKKYSHRDDPLFKQELYGNLGHITRDQGKWQQSINYYLESLKWTLITKDNQQIATNNYNVAFSCQQGKKYHKAEHYYNESIKHAILAGDDRTQENSTLRLIEVMQQQGNIVKAKEMLTTLPDVFVKDIQLLPNKALYQRLKTSLL